MFASSGGVRWLQPVERRRRRRVPVGPILVVLALLALAAGAFALVRSRDDADDPSRATAQRFADAWAKGDLDAAYALTTARTRREQSARLFRQSYRQSARAATARRIEVGEAGDPQDGVVPIPVTVRTRTFGALEGTIRFPVEREGDVARVAWSPDLRLPGLRRDERVDRRILRRPPRASVLDGDGRRLSRTASAAGLSASLDDAFDDRLSGRAGAELRFGKRVVAKVAVKRGRSRADDDPAVDAVRGGLGAGRPPGRDRRRRAAHRQRARRRRPRRSTARSRPARRSRSSRSPRR